MRFLHNAALPFVVAVLGVSASVLALRAQPPLKVEPASNASPTPPAPQGVKGVRLHGVSEPTKRPPGTLRLATYNVENLFDDKDDPKLSGEYEDTKMTKPEAHCKAVAEAIKKIDADVLALEEIESKEALLWFRDRYLKDLGYTYAESLDAGDERGIEQSVLSRYPIKDVKQWVGEELGGTHPDKFGKEPNKFAGKPIRFHRSPLRATIEAPARDEAGKDIPGKRYEITLFAVHLKSGGGGGYWRAAEAGGLVKHIGELQKQRPDANIIVLGDFNAQLSEDCMKTLVGAGLKDAFVDKTARDKTIQTHSSGRVLDHILLTPTAQHELVMDTRFVLGTITRPEGSDWRNTPAPDGWAADHYPVVIDLKMRD